MRDVEQLDHETLSLALALTMAGINRRYGKEQWLKATADMEEAVRTLTNRDE